MSRVCILDYKHAWVSILRRPSKGLIIGIKIKGKKMENCIHQFKLTRLTNFGMALLATRWVESDVDHSEAPQRENLGYIVALQLPTFITWNSGEWVTWLVICYTRWWLKASSRFYWTCQRRSARFPRISHGSFWGICDITANNDGRQLLCMWAIWHMRNNLSDRVSVLTKVLKRCLLPEELHT